MSHNAQIPDDGVDRSDWSKPLPEIIPPPTYSPSFMAAGVVFLVWGFLTHWVVTLVGIGFILASLITWLKSIRQDWKIK